MRKSLRSLGIAPLLVVAVAMLAGPASAQVPVEVNATVVDANGGVVGIASTDDAPESAST